MLLLDRYISKKFLGTLTFAIIGFIIIFVVLDLTENLDKFYDKEVSRKIVALYYLYYIPYIVNLTLPVSMLLASLFTMGQLSRFNELTAMKAAGISLYRILASIIGIAFLISLGSMALGETVVPVTNQKRLDIFRQYVGKLRPAITQRRQNIYLQDSENRKVVINYFDGDARTAYRVVIQDFQGYHLIKRIDAPLMKWDDTGIWFIPKGEERKFIGQEEIVSPIERKKIDFLRFKPTDLTVVQRKPEEMGYFELSKFVDQLRMIGGNPRNWVVDLYLKIAYPFANLIIVLFGAPLASSKRRSGTAVGVGIALAICFIYFVFTRVGQQLGKNGTLSPWLGAWIGNLVFGFTGLYTLIKVKK